MNKLILKIGDIDVEAELAENSVALAIQDVLPISARCQKWGKEIYFDTVIKVEKEKEAKQIVEKGEIAFWVEGQSIAVGFGPTPMSEADEFKLVTQANIFGDSLYDLTKLSDVGSGTLVRVEKISN